MRHSLIPGAMSATGMSDEGQWSSEGDEAFSVVGIRRSEVMSRRTGNIQ
jgi:hypothetical protein